MAFTTNPKAFKAIFKAFQNSHIGAVMTNINIWVPLSFSRFFLVSQMVYIWFSNRP